MLNRIYHFALKSLRKIVQTINPPKLPSVDFVSSEDVSEEIHHLLISQVPCMIARFGSTELNAVCNYLGVKNNRRSIWQFITNKTPQWWWNEKSVMQMQINAGFFPPSKENIARFSEMMIEDLAQVDILGSWRPEETFVSQYIMNAIKVPLLCLEPYWGKDPWSRALEDKEVLVIHPFTESIQKQYEKRELLFDDKRVLPTFKELHIIKAIQSLGGDSNGFKDWFEALQWMKNEMDKTSYDIALIGCGAYGFPLAAHAKRQGKKAVHLGGALQLLFGIKGKRWENPEYGKEFPGTKFSYQELINHNNWTYPLSTEKPPVAVNVEGGCYWK